MGVRPPTSGSGEHEAIEFGIATLTPMLEEADLEFPINAEAVVQSLGDPKIPVDAKGRAVALSVALEETGENRFESQRELLNAIHPVLESRRGVGSSGWLGTIRNQLPF